MEEETKPIRQLQRRLNPHLQEVVRAEVLKLLQAGIIYPISDSPWVSPTQVVPKKSGIIVVQKEKREEIKGKKKGKSIEKDGYDVNVQRELQRIVIKEELMKKHMPPPFLQALRNCKRNEGKSFGAKTEQKQSKNRAKTGQKQGSARFRNFCEISQLLRNRHFAAKLVHSLRPLSAKIFTAAKPILAQECHFAAQECHFAAQEPSFGSCETHCEVVKADFAPKVHSAGVFRNCEGEFGTRVPLRSTVTFISQLRMHCEIAAKMAFCCEIGVLAAKLKLTLSLPLFVFVFEPHRPSLRSSSPISNVGQTSVIRNGANKRG
ncbi:hypothetical protein CK203_049849 [Vitis vinifera]|uniref:Uncharacterized protein n=1 Tax=Vitis vinifera TaxID=29760 RepID=A0A438GVZ4_VITVI|nr:hypothetical protein CK203_049849 [Vitis vinifera]